MKQGCSEQGLTRRDLLAAGATTAAALALPGVLSASAPASRVAIVRCRDYKDFSAKLATGFDQIGRHWAAGPRQDSRLEVESDR